MNQLECDQTNIQEHIALSLPSQSANKTQVSILILLVLFSPLAIDIYLPALPKMAQDLSVTTAMTQDTITWFLFSMGVGQLFAGPLADKFGRKAIALVGVSIYGLSAALASVAHDINWLLAARLLQGLGACATSVAAFATVRDLFGPERSGKMISYLNGAICVIPALAPILGSWITWHFGWRSNFSFMASFAVIIFILMLFTMRESNQSQSTQSVFHIERYWAVVKTPSFLFHASLCMLAMAAILAYVTSAPGILMQQYGLSMVQFTWWFSANAIINIASCIVAPKIMDRIGVHKTIIIGTTLLVLAAIVMALFTSTALPVAFMLPVFISSVGCSLILGSAAGQALGPFGDKAGTAAAILGLFQMSGSGVVLNMIQSIQLAPQLLVALQMLIIAPALVILFSNVYRNWHPVRA